MCYLDPFPRIWSYLWPDMWKGVFHTHPIYQLWQYIISDCNKPLLLSGTTWNCSSWYRSKLLLLQQSKMLHTSASWSFQENCTITIPKEHSGSIKVSFTQYSVIDTRRGQSRDSCNEQLDHINCMHVGTVTTELLGSSYITTILHLVMLQSL